MKHAFILSSFFNKGVSIATVLALVAFSLYPFSALHAASLTDASDIMSRLAVDELSDHEIEFTTPSGVASTETIVLTFPSDFDGSNDPQGALDFNDVDFAVDASPDGVCDGTAQTLVTSGASSSQWNAAFSGTENRVLTLTSGGASATVPAGGEVCIEIGENATGGSANSQYINPSGAATYSIAATAGSSDSGNISVNILSDDQVSVSATVSQSITFTISDSSIGFGTLSSSAARYATGDGTGASSEGEAHTLVVGTNASNGYTLTVNGSTLTSGGDTIDAIGSTNTASSTGTEQFGIRATASGGSGAVSSPYAASGFAFDSAAFPDEIAAATGATSNTTYSMRYLANIGSSTEAGNYSATLTYLASANF
jgi:hypothetical protein